MQRKYGIAAAALAGSLALGAIAGPVVSNSVANAQTAPAPSATASPSVAPSQSTSPAAAPSALQSQFLDQLAASLNIQRSALDSAIVSAGTSTVDAAVQQGTLTQAQADQIKARLQGGDLGALWHGGRGGDRGLGGARVAGVKDAMLNAAAQTLGITADELTTQLRSGQTIAQLAQAHNTTEQAVIDAALAAAKTQLDQAVANNTLTQAQADQIYADLQARGADLFRGGRGGGHGRPGSDPSLPQPSPSSSAAPSS